MMKPIWALVLALPAFAALPFSVEAIEDASGDFPGAPRLQSFSFAQWEGRWVFIGGRTVGYHSVGGGSAEFLRKDANRDVWVVDTTVQPAKTYHAPLSMLPESLAPVRDQWAATAQLAYQDGETLYIAGGYGEAGNGKWTTFPVLTRANLPKLIDQVMRGQLSADAIQYVESPAVRSAGGGLLKLGDGSFYLVMGHVFEGNYTVFEGQGEQNSAQASQEYVNEIRRLEISKTGPLTVKLLSAFRDEQEFHRRDLNVVHALSPQGLGFAAYGGVFTPETQLNYTKPVYFFGSKPIVDATVEQHLNAYTCATLLLYDSPSQTMYTTLFGGIGRYHWNAERSEFVLNPRSESKSETSYLDGLQWSDQVSTLAYSPNGGTEELVHTTLLPSYLGTNAVFIPRPALERAEPDTEIIELSKLSGRVFVGYLYGGILTAPYQFPYTKSSKPHTTGVAPTVVNSRILKVYIEIGNAAK